MAPALGFLYTHLPFWIFLTCILGVFSLVYRRREMRNNLLFLAGIGFYFFIGGYLILALFLSILSVFLFGKIMEKVQKKSKRILCVLSGVIVQLFIWWGFKYADFFSILRPLLGDGLSYTESILFDRILLPVGLSIFSMQSMSYLFDLYRKEIPSQPHLIELGLYISFFPSLLGGPISLAKDFIPQLNRHYQLSSKEFSEGLFFILCGLVKIALFGYTISWQLCNPIFENPTLHGKTELWIAFYGLMMEIFCIFSGYTDIAIGLAVFFGFTLPPNFRAPYKAKSITDFWKRWYISLGNWIKTYAYKKNIFGLIIAFLLGCIWCGLSLPFLFWGLWNILWLCLEKPFSRIQKSPKFFRFLWAIICFHLIGLGWILFRSSSLTEALDVYRHLWQAPFSLTSIKADIIPYIYPIAIILLGFLIHWLPEQSKHKSIFLFTRQAMWVKFALTLLIIFCIYAGRIL